MDALEALTTRRSVRRFKSEPVDAHLIEKIVDAGRLAPTARNIQPCEFVVVTSAPRRAELAEISDHGKFIADAPACIVVLSKPTKYFLEDGSAATTNILNAATALGLGGCWVAGDKKPYAGLVAELLGAPADYRLIALVAIGYPLEKLKPTKRSLTDVLHWDTF